MASLPPVPQGAPGASGFPPPPPPGAPVLLLSGVGAPGAKSEAEKKVEAILASCSNPQDIIAALEAEIEKALTEALVSEERLKTTPDFLSILAGCEHLYEPGVIKGYSQLDAETRVAASRARAADMEAQVLALQEETRKINTNPSSSDTYRKVYAQIQARIAELEAQFKRGNIDPDPKIVQTNDLHRQSVEEYHKLREERDRMHALKPGDALPLALKLAICQHNATLIRTQKRLEALKGATVQSFSSSDVIMKTRQDSSKLWLRKDLKIYYEALVQQQFIAMLADGKVATEITAALSKTQSLYQDRLKAQTPDKTQEFQRLTSNILALDTGIQGKLVAIAAQKKFNEDAGITGYPEGEAPLQAKVGDICQMLASIEMLSDTAITLDFQMQIADCQSIAAANHGHAILTVARQYGARPKAAVPETTKLKATVTDRSGNVGPIVYQFSEAPYTAKEKVKLAKHFGLVCDVETLDSELDKLFKPFAKSPRNPDAGGLAGIAKTLVNKGVLKDGLYAPCELIENILDIPDINAELMRRKAAIDRDKAAIVRSAPSSSGGSDGNGSDVDSEMDFENNPELLRLGVSTRDLEERSQRQEHMLRAMQAQLNEAQQAVEQERRAREEAEKKHAEIEAIVRTASPAALLEAVAGPNGAKAGRINKGKR